MSSPWPNSPMLTAIRKVRKMVALSSALQTRAGITYATALASRVWTEYVPTIDELVRDTGNEFSDAPVMPWAAIWPMQVGTFAVSGGARVWTSPNGGIHLYLACQPLTTLATWNDKREEAVGFLDQWFQDVIALSGADDPTTDDGMGHLTITHSESVIIDHAPFKSRESTGDFYYQSYQLKYGDEN